MSAVEERRRRRQEEALDFMRRHVDERGYPPTISELQEGLGLRSKQTVHAVLAQLQAQGRIERLARSPRAIRIVPGAAPPESPLPLEEA